MKRFFCTLVALVMVLTVGQSVFASSNISSANGKVSNDYLANIVHARNVSATGIDLVADSSPSPSQYTTTAPVTIQQSSDSTVMIDMPIGNGLLSVIAKPIGRTENSDTVFYSGKSTDQQYDVVYFALGNDISKTNVYFKSVQQSKVNTAAVLQVYLRDTYSSTRDYYFVEVYDVDIDFPNGFVKELEVNPLLGAWAATQFEPISSEFGEDFGVMQPRAATNTKNWYCTKTYSSFGERQSHTIKWFTHVDYSDVVKGQEANQYYRLQVSGKSMTFSINTSLNSNTESFLHIDGLRLAQVAVPYTAWKSTSIDGYVQNNSSFGGTLSADIGVSLGVLNLTYSLPLTFSGSNYVDVNMTYTGYVNGVNNKYTRGIETEMASNFKLTQTGHNFEVKSVLRDYSNVAHNVASLKAIWYVSIINADTMAVYSQSCAHNVNVRVTN